MREFLNSFAKLEFDKVRRHIQRYAYSDLGREHLENLVPSSTPADVRYQLSLVSEMKQILEAEEYPPLQGFADLRSPLHRSSIEDYTLPAEALRDIGSAIGTGVKVKQYFTKRSETYLLLGSVVKPIQPEKILQYNILQAIDEDGNIRDSASRDLSDIRRQLREKKAGLRSSLESILKSLAGKDWTQEEIITTREGRMVIPVKTEHKNRVPGFIHSSSASGATVFIEPTVTLDLNNEIRSLEFAERREIDKILRALTVQVREERECLLENLRILGELDFIHARAKYSLEILGSEPKISGGKGLVIRNGYHPILLQKHRREEVVPLNLSLDEGVRTVIITGPNAGGKSVTLKTLGLLSILVQSGCHIPASPESEFPLFSDVYVDMGDEQSIENDLSSFSSHLENMKLILEKASSSSLILLDEVGSGTDPLEGASLAAAVLERLTEMGCMTIVTTHHGSLKSFAFENPRIENAAMEFDQQSLRPTYNFRLGIPGSSYALEMADRLKIPAGIIARSRDLKGTQATKLEDLIVELERRTQELNRELEAVNSEKDRLRSSMELHQEKVNSLEHELKALRAQAVEEARSIIERANATVEHAVREIRERSADRESIRSAKQQIDDLRTSIDALKAAASEPAELPGPIGIGDHVKIRHSDSEGTVLSRIDDSTFLVLVGGMKVKARSRDLLKTEGMPETGRQPAYHEPVLEVRSQIDLRGMYGDEAIEAIQKVLDSALVGGLHRIDIIHGKGTGALRKRVAEFLKNNPAIKSFRLGEWNEGGSGVTVVELE